MKILKEKGLNDVLLTGGGIIPDSDMNALHDLRVGKLFPPGTNTEDIVKYTKHWAEEHQNF